MMNDGVFSRRTGAGRMNEHVLQFVASVADRWTRVTLLATRVSQDSPAWSQRIWRRTDTLLSTYGWDLLEIPNQHELRGRYTGMPEWRNISRLTSEALVRLVHRRRDWKTGLLSSDVPFLGVNPPSAVTWLHVVHTLAALQAPDDREWSGWEMEQYSTWLARTGRLAVPSNFLRTRLLGTWPALATHMSVWRNGYPASEFTTTPVEERPRLSVLAYGRALPSKGLHLAVAAADMLNADGLPVRLTLIAIPEPTEGDYFRRLRDVAKSSGITRFLTAPAEDIATFISDPDLAAVVVPSIDEPAGLAPVETYCWGAGAIPVVVDSGGLPETVDTTTGIVAKGGDVQSLAESIRAAVELSHADRDCMVAAGRRRLARDHDFSRNSVEVMTACGLF
jgi:glycosyltransferase involved in cell wall biosynthesis